MGTEVSEYSASPLRLDRDDPQLVEDARSPPEKETNIMTQEELNDLAESCLFPTGVRIRLPDAGETIMSARPGEVTLYEAAFSVGLRFLFHPTLRRILENYNICPAQLVPNTWRSMIGILVLW